MKKLDGLAISLALTDKKVTPDIDSNKSYPPIVEKFHRDHKWEAILQAFSIKRMQGYWSVEGGKVCVISQSIKDCRNVWSNDGGGLIMRPFNGIISSRDNLIFVVADI